MQTKEETGIWSWSGNGK